MNPKDIGKKDWEIKQEFLKSNPMSQEEEKLIEEFINKIREIYNVVAHLPGKSLAFEDYILHHLRDGMHEAYRSGKLAGFEEMKNFIISYKESKEDNNLFTECGENRHEECIGYFGQKNSLIVRCICGCHLLFKIDSLIEEEKKKL